MRIRQLAIPALLSALLGLTVVGCQGRTAIPNDAHLENSGPGQVSYTASQPSDIWVLDETDNKLVWNGHVNTGDQIVVKSDENKIVVGGSDHAASLSSSHRYGIYAK